MAVGKRNVGKTYSTVRAIRDIVEFPNTPWVVDLLGKLDKNKPHEFIYMRRYIKSELDVSKDKVFTNVEDCTIENTGLTYVCKDGQNKRLCGYAISLSSIPKGIDFERVKIILFDEFVITDNRRYLQNEFECFANFLETVIRLRNDCIVVMLGNAKDFYNPYTLGWKIKMSQGQKRWSGYDKTVTYRLIEGDTYNNGREETVIGKLFKDTNYDKWANDNNFIMNTGANVCNKEKNSINVANIKTENDIFSIWTMTDGINISQDKGISGVVYNLDINNLENGQMALSRSNNYMSILSSYGKVGKLFFDNEETKNKFMPIYSWLVGI